MRMINQSLRPAALYFERIFQSGKEDHHTIIWFVDFFLLVRRSHDPIGDERRERERKRERKGETRKYRLFALSDDQVE